MKVELKQIIDQLTDAIGLPEGLKVSSLVDSKGEIKGWCIVKVYEDGRIEPVRENEELRSYKDLREMFQYEYDGIQ